MRTEKLNRKSRHSAAARSIPRCRGSRRGHRAAGPTENTLLIGRIAGVEPTLTDQGRLDDEAVTVEPLLPLAADLEFETGRSRRPNAICWNPSRSRPPRRVGFRRQRRHVAVRCPAAAHRALRPARRTGSTRSGNGPRSTPAARSPLKRWFELSTVAERVVRGIDRRGGRGVVSLVQVGVANAAADQAATSGPAAGPRGPPRRPRPWPACCRNAAYR